MERPTLPAHTHIGTVHLRVRDLEGLVAFYQDVLGFAVLGEDDVTAALGPDEGRHLLTLEGSPSATVPSEASTGLYHVAFLLPSRAALGAMLIRVREVGYAFQGFADHAVSEALYLADPEGNGIELYADRPRDIWRWDAGEVHMTTEPLDLVGLLEEGHVAASELPRETRIGHVHLRVSSLTSAEEFYVDRVGFEVTTRRYPGALFVAAGGYHHHLGLNVWGGVGAPRPPAGAAGLAGVTVVVPDPAARQRILGGPDHGEVADPDGIALRIVDRSSAGR